MKPATCHNDRPMLAKGLCRNCYYKDYHKTRPEYYKRKLAASQAWRDRNREHLRIYNKKRHTTRWANPSFREYRHRYQISRNYQIPRDEYDKLYNQQDGCCVLCSRSYKLTRHLAVDHNHHTNKVRGLLCNSCNARLGWYEKRKEKVDEYLKSDR